MRAAGPLPVLVLGLNALSGIGGVQTRPRPPRWRWRPLGLNALSGIGGVQTEPGRRLRPGAVSRLNALSGIGGVQTISVSTPGARSTVSVLMPCRALEAFRRSRSVARSKERATS